MSTILTRSTMVPIRGGCRVKLSQQRLRQNLSKRSQTSSSCPTVLSWTETNKDTPPMPIPPAGEEDESAQRGYGLPIPSQKTIPDDYECDNSNDVKDKKVTALTLHAGLILQWTSQMIVPRWPSAYPPLPERRFPETMDAETTTTTKKTTNPREGTPWL